MMQRLVTIIEAKNGMEHQNLSWKLGSMPDARKAQYNAAVAIEPTRTERLCKVIASFTMCLTRTLIGPVERLVIWHVHRLVLAHELGPAVVAHGRAVFIPIHLPAAATLGVVTFFSLKAALRAHEAGLVVVEEN